MLKVNCSECGTTLHPGLTFCEHCGATIPANTELPGISNTKRWILIALIGLFALLLMAGTAARLVSRSKETSTGAENGFDLNKTLDVKIYVAPGARDVLHASGLTEAAIKAAVCKALARNHVSSAVDSSVAIGSEDYVSVVFSTDHSAIFGSTLFVDIRLRNPASLVRWQATSAIMTATGPDVLAAIEGMTRDFASRGN